MESSSVYMCFPCYQEFSTLEEVLAHQLTCSAENTQLLANEAPGVEPAAATPPQVAVQSAELQSVELSSLLEQKKGTGPALDAPRVLYQCADCELLFDALSLWQEHRKTGCFLESAAGGGEPQSQEAESPAEPAPPKPPPDDSGPAAKRPRGQKKSKPPCSLLCVECGQSFSLVPELVTHRRSSHGLKEALHRCTVCGEGFLNTTLFLYHRKQHRSEADEPPRPPAVPQLSAAMLESHGEGLLLLATAGEGQLMERGLNVTPVAQLEVELEDDEGGAREECPRNEAEQVVQEGEEILVEMVEERAEAEPRGMAEEAESTGVAEEVESRGVVEEAGLTFLCHPCGCSFPSDQELSAHRRAQHGLEAALHTCTDCGDEFMNTTQFLYHRRVHRQSAGVRPAPTRPFSTASPAALAKARDDAALEPPSKLSRDWSRTPLPHECPHCGLGFTHRSRLREHVSQHTGEKLFSCNVCHKSFPSPSNLLRHTLTHGSARSHTCHACHKSFYQHTSLKRHMAVHQDGAQEAGRRGRGRGRAPANSDGSFHVCPECPASFRFEAQLKSHRLLHTSHPFPCSVCGEAFIRRKELDLHSLLHQDKEPKTCPNCSSQFLNQAALDSHLQRCSGEEVNRRTFKGQGRGKVGGQLECDMCGHRCVTQDGLDLHRLSHTGQTPLRCPLAPCRRRFASSSALGEHLVAHCCGTFGKRHAPSRYSCEFCGKEFAYPSTFAVHMRTHTNERPFECSHCGKRFRQLPHLQDHERIHSGERPFSCWVCGKSFSVAARLTEHARVHSGERPFVCPRCPTAFRSRANLDKHLRVHAADPAHPAAQSLMDDDAAVQTILLVQDSASSPAPGVQEGMLVAEEGGSSVVFLHPGLGVVAGQDVPHTIEVILEETV